MRCQMRSREGVAGEVAQRVVDPLELVHIDVQDGRPRLGGHGTLVSGETPEVRPGLPRTP
jgi:hypothetical protein